MDQNTTDDFQSPNPQPFSELIEFTTAESLAATYQAEIARIKSAYQQLINSQNNLSAAFGDTYHFSLSIEHLGHRRSSTESDWLKIEDVMRRAAWRAVIEKTGIRKVMSAKAAAKLNNALDGRDEEGRVAEPLTLFPDVTPEAIVNVVKGYAMSATEFLEEAVREEYDFWKQPKLYANYKRNDDFVLGPKIIRTYMVERGWRRGPNGQYTFHAKYGGPDAHVIALDNIFHLLDGKKGLEGYKGPLLDGINSCEDGKGETEYFRFRCYQNGNLHLEFKRKDLLALFNRICGRERLGGKRRGEV